MVLISVMLLVRVVLIAFALWYRSAMGSAMEGELFDVKAASRISETALLLGLVTVICWFALCICVTAWAYRSHSNVRLMGYQPRWSRDSTIWGFLIPGVNLLLIPLIMSDLVRGAGGPHRVRHRVLVSIWWWSLVASIVIDVWSHLMMTGVGRALDVRSTLDVGLAGEALAIVSWFSVLAFIRGAGAAQREGKVEWREWLAERQAVARAASGDGESA